MYKKSYRNSYKKSQVTIFVIIGLVLLIIAGIFIYFNSLRNTEVGLPERTEVTSEFKPVQSYIEDCMYSLSREAIEALGRHGGYIDPNDAYLSGRSFIKDPYRQYESDLAYFNENDLNSSIAYWYYSFSSGDCINCVMMSQIPYVYDMERQISIYVSENIDACLDNFTPFRNQGYIIDASSFMSVSTIIRDEDVVIESVYPINITEKGSSASMEKFYTIVDIPLFKYYNIALNISATEYNVGFLENFDIYLLNYYSGLDSKLFPPLYAYSDSYTYYYWSMSNVRKTFESEVTSYIPLFQVVNSRNYHNITSLASNSVELGFYNYLNLGLFNDMDLSKTDITFYYTGADSYLNIQPSDGELITATTNEYDTDSYLSGKRTNSYKYFYDISYPVIIELRDEYRPGEFYSFFFALESNIKENTNLRDWWNGTNRPLYWDPKYLSVTVDDLGNGKIISTPDYPGRNYTYKTRPTQTLFCDDSQKLSGDITLKTYDASTQSPVQDVSIYYGCGSYVRCSIGQSVFDETLNAAIYKSRLPICLNGYVELEKQGYQKKRLPLTTQNGIAANLGSIYLEPIIIKNVSVRKYFVTRKTVTFGGNDILLGYLLSNQTVSIPENDTVNIVFVKQISNTLDEPYTKTIFYDGSDTNLTVDLIPGRYEVKAQYISTGFIIHRGCQPICVSKNILGGCSETKYFPDVDVPFMPTMMWGGIEFDNQTTFTVSRTDLDTNNTLEIYIVRMPDPRCILDMNEVNMIPAISKTYRNILAPQFK